VEDFDKAQRQSDRIKDELKNMRHILEKIIETHRVGGGIEYVPKTSQTRAKDRSSE
jgi:hypothetical protein